MPNTTSKQIIATERRTTVEVMNLEPNDGVRFRWIRIGSDGERWKLKITLDKGK